MFLNLAHTKLEVYKCSRQFVLECYKLAKKLPEHEKYNLGRQIRRAVTSVTLNIAEGCSRKSAIERTRYFEISRGSIIEIDAAHLTYDLNYFSEEDMQQAGELIQKTFKMLSAMININRQT